MNLISSDYSAPKLLGNGHLATIYPHLFRKVKLQNYTREVIVNDRGEHLDLDWIENGHNKVLVLGHGLEGNSDAYYIKAMAKYFSLRGYDILAWNCPGCSTSQKDRAFYHSGATYLLDFVLQRVRSKKNYQQIYLAGFSMGGNIALKFLGEAKKKDLDNIAGAVAISTPLHLESCSQALGKGFNRVYSKYFLKTLGRKVKVNSEFFRSKGIDSKMLKAVRNIYDFDEYFTAPLFQFKGASDYYQKVSSLFQLNNIKTPCLILNAKNDPFLGDQCYPTNEEINNSNITAEYPIDGGHVGFYQFSKDGQSWPEQRTEEFFSSI